MYRSLYVNARHSCPIDIKHEFPRDNLEKCISLKRHYNPSSGSRVVPRGQADG